MLHKIQFGESSEKLIFEGISVCFSISVYAFFEVGTVSSFLKASWMKTLEFCNKMSFQIYNSWFKLASSSHKKVVVRTIIQNRSCERWVSIPLKRNSCY